MGPPSIRTLNSGDTTGRWKFKLCVNGTSPALYGGLARTLIRLKNDPGPHQVIAVSVINLERDDDQSSEDYGA
jgi:hypothetical protein